MGYRLTYLVSVEYAPDGIGQTMQGTSTNQLQFMQSGPFNPQIPGGNTLTAANLQTALTSMATDIFNQITTGTQQATAGSPTNLARLQAFSSNASM